MKNSHPTREINFNYSETNILFREYRLPVWKFILLVPEWFNKFHQRFNVKYVHSIQILFSPKHELI